MIKSLNFYFFLRRVQTLFLLWTQISAKNKQIEAAKMIDNLTKLFDYETEPQYYSLRVLERDYIQRGRGERKQLREERIHGWKLWRLSD